MNPPPNSFPSWSNPHVCPVLKLYLFFYPCDPHPQVSFYCALDNRHTSSSCKSFNFASSLGPALSTQDAIQAASYLRGTVMLVEHPASFSWPLRRRRLQTRAKVIPSFVSPHRALDAALSNSGGVLVSTGSTGIQDTGFPIIPLLLKAIFFWQRQTLHLVF